MSDTIKDSPAFPKLAYLDTPDQRGDRALVYEHGGMSQRALLAGMAMQAIIGTVTIHDLMGITTGEAIRQRIAATAVLQADTLIEQLSK